ncbi:tetracycline efflux MFS transporter Tet(V) [Phytohabitans flavus]|uniref:Tetracycline efflux MFS transporter Tet(V) n=1 Tax=Phytohabitans flavus TaxID=1076124 RepID=A0A6F8Y3Z9_9ACTN|nr:MFS transporter [Phytohabitans flavus]BCB80825.1 tetracycline efflux MFS transporter Tet(V) [Phytohabitans flavus]
MSEGTATSGSRWLRGPLRPFRQGQYRLLAGWVTMSLFAGGIWLIALVWQVIALGGGPTELSLVSAAAAGGMVATTLLGGVLADRVPQRSILLAVAVVRTVMVAVVATLAVGDLLQLWHLAVVAGAVGLANGFTYPAYSALLPSVLPPEDLMAANGVEGMLRPTIMQAAGPALASALIAASSPGAAIVAVAVVEAIGVAFLLLVRPVPLRREKSAESAHPVRAAVVDLKDGFVYMVRTPWLLATLLFASVLILLTMGPVEVLIPFVIKDRAGGGPGDHAIVMAAYGIGGAIGSLGMATFKMPRRYLTVMNLFWGIGCLPLVLIGLIANVWVIAAAVFVVGLCFSAPMVIWGTLLQRRVPSHMLGRVSSLDFFVSLVFMPVSMAVAGPVSAGIGLGVTFAVAGLVPTAFAVLAIVLARMPKDELANPLDVPPADTEAESAKDLAAVAP